MTKQINRNIRFLKNALNELNNVDIDRRYNHYDVNMIKSSIECVINDLEEEYQNLHKIGAYKND